MMAYRFASNQRIIERFRELTNCSSQYLNWNMFHYCHLFLQDGLLQLENWNIEV